MSMPDERDEEVDEIERELERRLERMRFHSEDGDVGANGPPAPEEDEVELKLREFDQRLDQVNQNRVEKEGLFETEFETRLQALHEKADRAKARNENKQREFQRTQVADQASAKGLGIGLTVAYTIVGLPLAGAGIGWAVDRWLGTNGGVGIGVILGMVLGMTMALVMLSRMNQEQ